MAAAAGHTMPAAGVQQEADVACLAEPPAEQYGEELRRLLTHPDSSGSPLTVPRWPPRRRHVRAAVRFWTPRPRRHEQLPGPSPSCCPPRHNALLPSRLACSPRTASIAERQSMPWPPPTPSCPSFFSPARGYWVTPPSARLMISYRLGAYASYRLISACEASVSWQYSSLCLRMGGW